VIGARPRSERARVANVQLLNHTAGWEGDNLVVTRSIVDGALSVTQTMSREDDKLAVVVTFTGTTTAGDHLVAAPVTQTYVRR